MSTTYLSEKTMAEGRDSKFSTSALKVIDNASCMAILEGDKLAKISKDVGEMGAWSLFWDSKVPEKDKSFWYRCNLTPSNRDHLLGEIRKYESFYSEMKSAMHYIRNGEEDEISRLEEIVDELYTNLEELSSEAESCIESTDSRTIMRLHKDFVSKHEKLENMVRRVESVGMRQKQKMLTDKLEKSLKGMDTLKTDLENALEDRNDMKQCLEEMKAENEKSKAERLQLMNENKQILAALKKLLGEQ